MPDLVVATLGRLLGPFGIRKKGAAHADHVGLAVDENLLGEEGVVDAVAGDHRDLYSLPDAVGEVDVGSSRHIHRGERQERLMPPSGDIDQIDASFLKCLDYGLHFRLPVAALHEIVTGGAIRNRETGADAVSNSLDHLHRESHPLFEIAAVFVGASVGQR